jgi:hypothetical protein
VRLLILLSSLRAGRELEINFKDEELEVENRQMLLVEAQPGRTREQCFLASLPARDNSLVSSLKTQKLAGYMSHDFTLSLNTLIGHLLYAIIV